MPRSGYSIVILKQVDSTNNYAMAKVHAGMAKHGDAYFTSDQTAGKGQRGKSWLSDAGASIALSVVLQPKLLKIQHPFQLSAAVGLAAFDFFSQYAGDETRIKWPNDIYWRDRKAGGILIENKFSGRDWNWAVIGIGININETNFDPSLVNPVSLKQVTGKTFDTIELANELHKSIMKRADEIITKSYDLLLTEYNNHLYKLHEQVKLKKDTIIFETTIGGVSSKGQLITVAPIEKHFEFGEVEWMMG